MARSTLWTNRDFQVLCLTQGLSKLGTQMSAIALPLLALQVDESPAGAATVAVAAALAQIIALLPGGSLADRVHRRALAITCDIGCVLSMALLSGTILFGQPQLAMLVAAAIVTGGFGSILHSTSMAILRRVVSDIELPDAVAVNQARNAAVYLAGPLLGGALFYLDPAWPFIVDTVTFTLSAGGWILIRSSIGRTSGADTSQLSVLGDLVAGVSFLWRQLCLRWTLLVASLANCAFAGILLTVLIGSSAQEGSSISVGFVISCAGAGSLIGSLIAVRAKELAAPRTIIIMVIAGCAALTAVLTLRVSPLLQGLVLFLCACLVPTMNVILGSAQMLLAPDELQGRIQAASSFLATTTQPLGLAAAGILLSAVPPNLSFLAFTALLIATALLSSLNHSLRHLPDLRTRINTAARA